MKKIQTFSHVFINSFNPSYYNELRKTKFAFSFKYFTFLNFLIALVIALIFTVPIARFQHQEMFSELKNAYPEDLEITYDQRGITVNQELPYSINIPEDWGSFDYATIDTNFITFDSDEHITSISDFYEMDTIILITESTLYMLEDSGELNVRKIPARTNDAYIFDQAVVNELTDRIENHSFFRYKLYVPVLAAIALIFMFVFGLIGRLLSALIYAVITFVISKIFMADKKLDFGKTYQFVLHTITPLILLTVLINRTDIKFFTPMINFFAMMAWTIFIISQLEVKKTPAKSKKSNK